jgi:predicted nucleic acid-binding protein
VILADTSAWIEYLRATCSPVHQRLRALLVSGDTLAVTDVVLMEVLAGAADDAHRDRLRRLLAGCEYVPVESPEDYEQAADLYRLCRARGVTVRGLADCLIAVVALRCGAAVLHADRDFDAIAACMPLQIAGA